MTKNTKSFALPLTFIGIMFFAIGFALGINSLLVPVLQKSLGISNTASYLIIAATFIPFLVFGYPAGLTIKAIGYKRTMSLSFFIFAVAFYLFILSASQESFTLFLLASFISGAANAYLQASVNPYITILGPLDSAAKRISIMGICNKLAWPIPAIFIVWLLGKDVSLIGIEDLSRSLSSSALLSPWVSWHSSHRYPKSKQPEKMKARTKPKPARMLQVKLPFFSSRTCCWAVWHCSFM